MPIPDWGDSPEVSDPTTRRLKFSVVIINYNYGRFLRESITSALDMRYPDKEIIVCDDGSIDDSESIIRSFGDKIIPIFKKNGGQLDAANVAINAVTGDVVFFLDSDDALLPDAAQEVAKVWIDDRVAKMQFPMLTMTEAGKLTGSVYPNYPQSYTPQRVKESLRLTSFYLSSPTSGNAWSKKFLDRVFPLPVDQKVVRFIDGYLSTLAPFCGEVITISKPLARYRINSSNMWTTRFSPELIAENCEEDIIRSAMINEKLESLGIPDRPIHMKHCYTHMMKRVVYKRFLPEKYQRLQLGDRRPILLLALFSVVDDPDISAMTKLFLFGWLIAVTVLPKPIALSIVKMKYVTSYRPAIVTSLLTLSGWRGRARA